MSMCISDAYRSHATQWQVIIIRFPMIDSIDRVWLVNERTFGMPPNASKPARISLSSPNLKCGCMLVQAVTVVGPGPAGPLAFDHLNRHAVDVTRLFCELHLPQRPG